VLYISSSCPAGAPPQTVSTCLAAANRTDNTSNGSSEEVMCQSLAAGQQVFLFVDEVTLSSATSGTFSLEATRCTREIEPNGTPATASNLLFSAEGSVNPAGDADFFNLGTPPANSRVFAMIDGIAANVVAGDNAPDFDLRVTTTTDTLEYDDTDNDVAFGSLSPNIAGTRLTGVSSFIRVSHFSATTAAEPYRLYAVVQPPGAGPGNTSATTETEPNDLIGQATSASNNYFYGTLSAPAPSNDIDLFRFSANAGDLVFLSLDCDPLRNNTPVNGALALLDA